MKNILSLLLITFCFSSCSLIELYSMMMNGQNEYQFSTDCGPITVKSAFGDAQSSSTLEISLVSSDLWKYSIRGEKLNLFVNSKNVKSFQSMLDKNDTVLTFFYKFPEQLRDSAEIFLLADRAIMCNDQSLMSGDTIRFRIHAKGIK